MIMRAIWFVLPTFLVGCVSQPRATHRSPAPAAVAAAIPERPATRLVETRYEVRAYHDANDPTVRHDSHAIYRATRVPLRQDGAKEELATVPRVTFHPASHAPLPANAELAAELVTQKQITGELRTIQSAMSATQREAQEKFGELVNQTAETVRVRRDLEAERARVQRLEASLRERAAEVASTPAPLAAELKW
jgi:hypothetical protein